jgi:hypothetical protein
MQFPVTIRDGRFSCIARILAFSLLCLGSVASAQSTDISAPAPVRTNEVIGSIAARDIGDSRLTDHFFAFTGTPGDLLITIDSRNINGDVDVFTTSGLRPLLKLTVYASNSSPVTKSIYLRKRESLILRIEGRTPNDDEGTYRLYFGGSFEPLDAGSLLTASEGPSTEPTEPGGKTGKKGRRVTSVGARIEEPPQAEVASAPAPEPTPAESKQPEDAKTETPRPEAARTEVKTEIAKTPARTVRGRRPPGRRTPTAAPPKKEVPKSETEKAPTTTETEAEAKPTPTRKRPAKKSTTARSVEAASAPVPQEPEPESGPRLVIEIKDGTTINRYMSSVRRVVVERGQVVVTGNDGKTERVPLANVVRMSIAP